jgi:hypothetical protein
MRERVRIACGEGLDSVALQTVKARFALAACDSFLLAVLL